MTSSQFKKLQKLKEKHLTVIEYHEVKYEMQPFDKTTKSDALLLFNRDSSIELIKQTKTFQIVKITTQAAESKICIFETKFEQQNETKGPELIFRNGVDKTEWTIGDMNCFFDV